MNKNSEPLLDLIRARPGMYLGGRSLTALLHFVNGFQFAYLMGGRDFREHLEIPHEFHAWVAYRLRFDGGTRGWLSMILERTASEEEAFAQFFDLLDEFRERKPHVVAKLLGVRATIATVVTVEDGVTSARPFADSVSLVTYTDDPGFFIYADETSDPPSPEFCPTIEWFETFTGAKRDKLTVIDHSWNYGLPKEV